MCILNVCVWRWFGRNLARALSCVVIIIIIIPVIERCLFLIVGDQDFIATVWWTRLGRQGLRLVGKQTLYQGSLFPCDFQPSREQEFLQIRSFDRSPCAWI